MPVPYSILHFVEILNCSLFQSIKQRIGEKHLKELINFTLREFSDIDLPVKRGNFVEFRNASFWSFIITGLFFHLPT